MNDKLGIVADAIALIVLVAFIIVMYAYGPTLFFVLGDLWK